MKFVLVAGSYEAFLFGYEFSPKGEDQDERGDADLHRKKALSQIESEGLCLGSLCFFVPLGSFVR